MDVLGDGSQLVFGEATERVLHHLEVLVEMAGPFGLGELRQERRRIPVGYDEVMRRRKLRRVGAPQLLAPHQLGRELGDRVGHEGARDPRLQVAFRAVVEQRASGLDGRGRVGHVVGQHLVVVDRASGGQCHDTVVHDRARRGRRRTRRDARLRGCHGCERYAYCPCVTTYDRPFGRYFEDFEPGDIYKHWPGKTITEYDDHLFCLITMNHHPTHRNAWFAENESPHGKNLVVGNLVYSLVLGMSVPDVSGSCIANLEVETLRHAKPTFHGDTIYAETRVLEKRLTSKADRGIVTVETKGINQRGEEVCYFKRKLMVWTQDAAPPRGRPYDETIWEDANP